MMVSVLLIGCGKSDLNQSDQLQDGNESSEEASTAAEDNSDQKYRVGMLTLPGDTALSRAARLNVDTVAEAAGIEVVRTEIANYDDNSFMTAYESLINQGVDAVCLFTLSETVIPLLIDKFEENNVKFFLYNRKISTKEFEDQLFASPMCIGNEHADETQVAYEMVKELKEEYDIKNLAVIGLTQGDINGGYRDTGIEKACKEFDINLVNETRGINTTEDVTKAMDGIIASYPDLDSVFITAGLVQNGALAGLNQSIVNNRLEGKISIAMIDISTGMSEYMGNGPLKIVGGGNLIADVIFAFVTIANDLHGTPLAEHPIIDVNMFMIRNPEDAINYDKYIEGTIPPFSAEEYQETMFKWLNPDVTLESVQQIAKDFTIESIMEKNKNKS
jgi:ABC-type sugar transport system substrate-binding protein